LKWAVFSYPTRKPAAVATKASLIILVEANGKSPLLGTRQVDFHHHGHTPGQALIDTQQNVGGGNRLSRRSIDIKEGHW
jgi:hypothetical protein